MNLHDLFAIARERDPARPALCWMGGDGRRVIPYGELFAQTDELAHELAARGLGRGDRVAFLLGNRPEWVVALLAALRVGAVVVPLNLAYRRHELGHILADATPRLLLTESSRREVLAEVELAEGPELLDVDGWEWGMGRGEFPPISGSDLAMLLYTSGTTGRSKGAELTHDNLLATITGLLAAWGWSRDDTLLLTLPLFHTHGLVVGLCCALAAGATVELRERFEAESVWHELGAGHATLFFGVPTMYSRLLALARSSRPVGIERMRLFCCGSAPLPAETLAAFREATGHTILERYGMTETGMLFSNPVVGARVAGTVGVPLPGVSARIVDGTDRPVADGIEGELQVRGANVFAGYWGDVEKTHAAFVIDSRGQRWFRTGDLARRDPETGYVTLLGRRHDLVISGGYNIYPREIEEVLCELPGIREAAVVGRPHPEWGEVPVAFLVVDPGFEVDTVEAACRERIAAFKVPKRFELVESLPRNALGKVEKGKLPR